MKKILITLIALVGFFGINQTFADYVNINTLSESGCIYSKIVYTPSTQGYQFHFLSDGNTTGCDNVINTLSTKDLYFLNGSNYENINNLETISSCDSMFTTKNALIVPGGPPFFLNSQLYTIVNCGSLETSTFTPDNIYYYVDNPIINNNLISFSGANLTLESKSIDEVNSGAGIIVGNRFQSIYLIPAMAIILGGLYLLYIIFDTLPILRRKK